MYSSRPRTLSFYWDRQSTGISRRKWHTFITTWVQEHRGSWELAELHWLDYVEDWAACKDFELLSGAKLSRQAEGSAQSFLAIRMAGGLRCGYCGTIKNGSEVHVR